MREGAVRSVSYAGACGALSLMAHPQRCAREVGGGGVKM
jgi:hypothetical protein